MGILNALERFLRIKPAAERVELKEIVSKVKGATPIKEFRTAAVGTDYKNIDGSERQEALQNVKVGDAVRLIWESGETDGKDTVYLVRKGRGQELSLSDCFGRLNDRVTADVIRWLTKENIVTAATVVEISGGTRKRPKLACTLELKTYLRPE